MFYNDSMSPYDLLSGQLNLVNTISSSNKKWQSRPKLLARSDEDGRVDERARMEEDKTLATLTTKQARISNKKYSQWIMHVDCFSNQADYGANIILTSLNRHKMSCALRLKFRTSNNEDEYEILISELKIVGELGEENLYVNMNSSLAVCQVIGEYTTKEPSLQFYLNKMNELKQKIREVQIVNVL